MSSASDSRSLQPLPTPDAAAEPTVCVLKVGAEAGSIRLLARPQAKGPWEYAVTTAS